MRSTHVRKEARIDASKISQEKRTLAVDEQDFTRLHDLVTGLENCNDLKAETTDSNTSVSKAKKKHTKRNPLRPMGILSNKDKEVLSSKKDSPLEDKESLGKKGGETVSKGDEVLLTEEEKKVKSQEEEKTKLASEIAHWGFNLPHKYENGALEWKKGCKLPAILEELQRMIIGVFNNIKADEFNGFNFTLIPPSDNRTLITTIAKTDISAGARVLATLASPENFTFRVIQGKIDAEVEVPLLKDQAIMMTFGIANSSSLSFNNLSSYIHKMNASSRGISRAKQPNRRWIVIVDYIASDEVISKQIKEAILSAKGDGSKKINGNNYDLNRVVAMAEAKAAKNKVAEASLETPVAEEKEVPQENLSVNEVPQENLSVNEVPQENLLVDGVPQEEDPVNEVPQENLPVDEVPQEEDPVDGEVPQEEDPIKQIFSKKNPISLILENFSSMAKDLSLNIGKCASPLLDKETASSFAEVASSFAEETSALAESTSSSAERTFPPAERTYTLIDGVYTFDGNYSLTEAFSLAGAFIHSASAGKLPLTKVAFPEGSPFASVEEELPPLEMVFPEGGNSTSVENNTFNAEVDDHSASVEEELPPLEMVFPEGGNSASVENSIFNAEVGDHSDNFPEQNEPSLPPLKEELLFCRPESPCIEEVD